MPLRDRDGWAPGSSMVPSLPLVPGVPETGRPGQGDADREALIRARAVDRWTGWKLVLVVVAVAAGCGSVWGAVLWGLLVLLGG